MYYAMSVIAINNLLIIDYFIIFIIDYLIIVIILVLDLMLLVIKFDYVMVDVFVSF